MGELTPEVLRALADELDRNRQLQALLRAEDEPAKESSGWGSFWIVLIVGLSGFGLWNYLEVM